jgi:sec-independent protein translocase protein TatB
MFSIPHLIVIFVVALIIFGPEKLPELARNLGKVMGEFRRATGDLQSTFEGHLRDLERDAETRRIGGGSSGTMPPVGAAAGQAAPNAETVAEVESAIAVFGGEPVEPNMVPALGTVPSNPPNASAIAAGNAAAEPAVAEPGAANTEGSASHPQPLTGSPESEHNPENKSAHDSSGNTPDDTYDHVSDGRFGQS